MVDKIPVIMAKGLTRKFGDLVAVNGLDLEVNAGEVFGFLGHNGAGKTTTIRLLNGILEANGGEVKVLGYDPIAEGPLLRRRTGVLTENPSLDERLTARENLRIYANLYDVPVKEVENRIRDLLTSFELEDRADEKVGGFSKGMKQRMALARSIMHRPELLFLDEPTSGLDPIAAKGVRDLVREMSEKEGHTVFICTHNLDEAQRLCDRVAVLEHGSLLAIGTPAELGRRYGHRQRLMIEVAQPEMEKTTGLLTAMGASEIEINKHTISFTGFHHDRVPEMIWKLSEAGIHLYGVSNEEPSLEEVYFALHQNHTPKEVTA